MSRTPNGDGTEPRPRSQQQTCPNPSLNRRRKGKCGSSRPMRASFTHYRCWTRTSVRCSCCLRLKSCPWKRSRSRHRFRCEPATRGSPLLATRSVQSSDGARYQTRFERRCRDDRTCALVEVRLRSGSCVTCDLAVREGLRAEQRRDAVIVASPRRQCGCFTSPRRQLGCCTSSGRGSTWSL